MLKSKGLKLTPIKKEYIDSFLKWFNDPEITQYLIFYRPLTREMEEDWYNTYQTQQNEIVFSILISEELNHEKLIGNCGIRIDWKNRVGNCGIIIGEKEYLSKGYGTEAMELLVEYGFNTLNLNRIELEVYDFNIQAIKSYKKVGFLEEGRKRQATYINGEYHGIIIMSILKEEWKEDLKS